MATGTLRQANNLDVVKRRLRCKAFARLAATRARSHMEHMSTTERFYVNDAVFSSSNRPTFRYITSWKEQLHATPRAHARGSTPHNAQNQM